MSEATHYWPEEPGFYELDHTKGRPKSWRWSGVEWEYMFVSCSTAELEAMGYLGVRREAEKPANTLTPTPKTITPDPDDGNAMVAQQALAELQACQYAFHRDAWAKKWGPTLCEIAGAR